MEFNLLDHRYKKKQWSLLNKEIHFTLYFLIGDGNLEVRKPAQKQLSIPGMGMGQPGLLKIC